MIGNILCLACGTIVGVVAMAMMRRAKAGDPVDLCPICEGSGVLTAAGDHSVTTRCSVCRGSGGAS